MKNKFKSDKVVKTILVVVIVYFIVMLVIYLPRYIRRKYEKLYIVTNNYRIKFEEGQWSKFDDIVEKKEKYNIFENGKFIGKYDTLLLNRIMVYGDDKEIDISGDLFAYKTNIKMELINSFDDINKSDIDKNNISNALTKLGIKATDDLSFYRKNTLDVDNDGVDEYIYVISNYYSENDDNNRFSIIFMVDDDNVFIIGKETTTKDMVNLGRILSIENIMDIKKDGSLEVIYSSEKTMGNREDNCVVLYNLKSRKEIKNFCE